ncbi:ubiquinol-cytochrome c reductase iron-sulfur subunit [Caldibacillus lycopersici]|uniref:Menaquinol:cytochrome c reductase iron-sulfur subunit n=1 Tax=Perspicuibacillus lycopersici TaxID=1325689 RepID=A0AAE3ISA4_9BACI|nr:ubiquinol-cytochrome c reductase iron-sulfur subunit [Perspicuibacillus lycopersici]MCU9613700.1 ubiquinol-cytochrome c reductase iron-sulfur subunit [Perspicuibacillus lycopersici]
MSDKQRVTRRQFLTYTLMGVGGFMAAGTVMPMLRFAVDPALQAKAGGDLIATGLKESEITNEPQRVDFKFDQQDGWYESQVTQSAWVYKDNNGDIIALSPICKHLGCTVNWNGNEEFPNQFYCPCHFGRYEKDGTNVKGTPPRGPLDRYDYEIKDGVLYLSMRAKPRGGA